MQPWIKQTLDELEALLAKAEDRLSAANRAFEAADAEQDRALIERNQLYNLLRSFRDYSNGDSSEVPL